MAEIVDFGLQQHKIKMDSRYFENVLSVVAGDTGRRIEVQLLDTNGMVQDTTGLNLRLNAEIAGKATFTDATLVDAVTGKYQLDLSNGMFMAPGNWQFQWQIIDSAGKKLHSFAFTGNIGKNISEGGSQATNFYLNLEDLKAMQEDLVNGSFNSEVLETNIAEKLNNLEEQYAPKLTEVTVQLAQTEQEFNARISQTIATAGDGSIPSELTDLRVDSFGNQFQVSGDRIKNIEEMYTQGITVVPINWELGGIDSSNGQNVTHVDWGMRTEDYLTIYDSLTLSLPVGVRCQIIKYSQSNVYVGMLVDFKGVSYTLEPKSLYKYRFVVFNVSSSDKVTELNQLTSIINVTKEIVSKNTSVLSSSLEKTKNLLNEGKVEIPLSNWEIGGIASTDGIQNDSVNWGIRTKQATQYLKPIIFNVPETVILQIFEYDIENNFLKLVYNSSNTIITFNPSESNRYRILMYHKDGTLINKVETIYNKVEMYMLIFSKDPKTILKGKTINVLSDSMGSTDYTIPNWWQQIATETGATFNDYGFSGTTLAHTNDRHLWGKNWAKFPEGTEIGGCFVERYSVMDSTADGVLVLGSTNDEDVPKGEWNSSIDSDFFGALNILMLGLKKVYAGKPIIFMTPVQASNSYSTNVPNPTETLLNLPVTSTLTLQLRAEAIKLKCNQYGIACIDLYNQSGISGVDTNKVYYRTSDILHLSSTGHNTVKKSVKPVLIDKLS